MKLFIRVFYVYYSLYFMSKINVGFMNCIKYVHEKLNGPKIFIGENGFPENEGLDDSETKIAYHTVSIFV